MVEEVWFDIIGDIEIGFSVAVEISGKDAESSECLVGNTFG
jgi:hypothetical protein